MAARFALLLVLLLLPCCKRAPPTAVHGVILSSSAGVRFPRQPEQLGAELDHLLESAESPPPTPVTALVVPHAGLQFSGKTAAAAFAPVRDHKFARVVLLAPSHAGIAPGAVLPRAHAFRTPLGEVPVDQGAVGLLEKAGFRVDDAPFLDEHSIDAVLPFLQRALGAVPIVPVLVGPADITMARGLAQSLQPLVDARTLVIVSTNLTHHGPRFGNMPFDDAPGAALRARIAQADAILLKPLLANDLAAFDPRMRSAHAGVCGQDALRVLLALLPPSSRGQVRDYDNSFAHDDSTPADQVSYAAVVFGGSWPDVAPFPEADRVSLLQSARAAMVAAASALAAPVPPLTSPRTLEKRGVFVTLYAGNEVRASVGQLRSDEPLGRAVLALSSAALHAPDASPISAEELVGLRIELAICGPLHGLRELSELQPGRQGVYLESAGKTALLLPEPAGSPLPTLDGLIDALAVRARLPREQVTAATLRTFDAVVLSEPREPSDGGSR